MSRWSVVPKWAADCTMQPHPQGCWIPHFQCRVAVSASRKNLWAELYSLPVDGATLIANWSRFLERSRAYDPRGRILSHIEQVRPWLDSPIGEAVSHARREWTEQDYECGFKALPLLRLKLLRDQGITGDDTALTIQIQKLYSSCQSGAATEVQSILAARLANAFQLTEYLLEVRPQLQPSETAESANADRLFTDGLTASFTTLFRLMRRSTAGSASAANIADLQALSIQVQTLCATATTNFQRRLAASRLATIHYWSAINHAFLKQEGGARAAFEKAAEHYREAGENDSAEDCLRRAKDVSIGFAADTDEAFLSSVDALVRAATSTDPLARSLALESALNVALESGDRFEGVHLAAQLTNELTSLGLLDPQDVGFDAAFESWMEHVPSRPDRTAYLRAFYSVFRCFLRALAARAEDRADPARAKAAFDLLTADDISSMPLEAERQVQQLDAELNVQWMEYLPDGETPTGTNSDADREEETARNRLRQRLETEWARIFDANESRAYEESRSDLLAQASALQQLAAALGIPYFSAKARLISAQILLYCFRSEEAVTLLEDARSLIIAAQPLSYGPFATSPERNLYLTILKYKAYACGALKDPVGLSATCEEAIRSIESQRYLINSPERQNAFLDWRADFYIYGVASARQLQQWDTMLERMELIKARSLIRSHLVPDAPDLDAAQLQNEFRSISDQLQRASPDQNIDELASCRRQLWDLLSVARARQRLAGIPPEISVRNIQNALASDEAAVSFFWQTDSVLLAVVIDSQHFHLERIELSAADLAIYSEFVEAIQAITGFTSGIDDALAHLGPLLLPASVRTQLEEKHRILISPHRTLHLFPFHACPWDTGFLGQRFAVRYAPNLSTLLLNWPANRSSRTLALGISHFSLAPFDRNPLPLAEIEAARVTEIHRSCGSPAVLFGGAEASRTCFSVLRDDNTLNEMRCLHLATHGTSVYGDDVRDHPMESRLILQDGWLDGLEIANLPLQADLVVLSACNSGQRALAGRGLANVPGDDLFGLQSAFFNSGVRGVLGALWPLADQPAFEFITRFHQHYATGIAADYALQNALNSYLEECPRREAFYWAGWFLTTLGSNVETHASL